MSNTIKAAIQALKSRVADAYTAISQKGGTLPATQDSANLPAAIASIPSGGEVYLPNDFNFVDCFGLQQSYSKAEIDAMTELPTPKTYEGLTFDGWSRTLSELKSLSCCTIGGFYHTTDNKTWIKIGLKPDDLTFSMRVDNDGVIIEWGDGEQSQSAPGTTISHTYSQEGEYIVKIGSECSTLLLTSGQAKFIEFYFGSNISSLYTQTFRNTINLRAICVPRDASSGLAKYFFDNWQIANSSIRTLVVPSTFTGNLYNSAYAMNNTTYLQYIVADGVVGIGNRPTYNMSYNLISLSAKSATSVVNSTDSNSYKMPVMRWLQFDSLETYQYGVFAYCLYYEKIDLPSSLTSISASFGGKVKEMYVRCSTPPTMSLVAFLIDTFGVIHIPAGTTAAYEAATNWASFAGFYKDDL